MKLIAFLIALMMLNHCVYAQSTNQSESEFYSHFSFKQDYQWDSLRFALTGHRVQPMGRSNFRNTSCALTKKIFGWYPTWAGTTYRNYDWSKLSDICYFDYTIDPNTGQNTNSGFNFLSSPGITAAQSNGVKTHLCISLFSGLSSFFANANNQQQTLINNVISLLQQRNAKGINVDFEGMYSSSYKTGFTNFVKNLSNQLHTSISGSILSLDIQWSSNIAIDFSTLNSYVDLWIHMGYDYSTGSPNAGPTDPLNQFPNIPYWLTSTVNSYLNTYGLSPSKFILALPYYGVGWGVNNACVLGTTNNSGIYHKYISDILGSTTYYTSSNLHHDNNSNTDYYCFTATSPAGPNEFFIDGLTGMGARFDLINNKNLAGVAIFVLGGDDGTSDYWNLIGDKFTNCATSCNLTGVTPSLVSPGTTSSPGQTISTTTPTLSWTPITGAGVYGVYIRDIVSNTLVYDQDCATTSASFIVPTGILSNGGQYRWNIKAFQSCGSSCMSNIPSPIYFNISTIPTVTIQDFSITPSSINPCGTFQINYTLNASSSTTIMLGASIRPTGNSDWPYSDAQNDKKITISSGTSTQSRNFSVYCPLTSGIFDVLVAVWLDTNGNGIIDNGDTKLSELSKNQLLTITSTQTCTTPGTPSNAVGTATGQTSANLSWSAGNPIGSATINYYWVVGTSQNVTYGNGTDQGITTGTSATSNKLTCDIQYYLRVYAVSTCNNIPSGIVTSSAFLTNSCSCPNVTTPVAAYPTNFSSSSFNANWNNVTNASGYRLDVSALPDFSSFLPGFNNLDVGNTTSKSVSGLSCGTTYYYRVRAYNSCGNMSGNSDAIFVNTNACNGCSSPTKQAYEISFDKIGPNSVEISSLIGDGQRRIIKINTVNSFTDPVNGTDPIANNNYSGSGEQVIYNGTGNLVNVTGLSPNTSYCFKVYEFNCSNNSTVFLTSSGTNNPKCRSTSDVCPTLIAPTNLSPGSTTFPGPVVTSNPTFTWTTTGAAWYHFELSKEPFGPNNVIASGCSSITPPYTITTPNVLQNGINYRWSVSSIPSCVSACSATSTYYYFTYNSCPSQTAPVANAATNNSSTSFQVNWNPVAGAYYYTIDVATDNTFNNVHTDYNNKYVGNVTSFIVTGLNCNTQYYYRVRASNTCNNMSLSSNYIAVKTDVCCASLTTPGAINGSSNVCEATAQLYYISPVTGADSYTWTLPNGWSGTSTSASIIPTVGPAGGKISVTANNSCGNVSPASSLDVIVTSKSTPSVSISASPSSTICTGQSVTFTANPTNAGTNPTYEWKIGNTAVGTGATYTTSALINGQVITCIMTTSNACVSNMAATSNAITMAVNGSVTPSVSIALTNGSNPICSGQSVTFTATQTNGGANPTYQWKVGNTNVGTGSTYTTTSLTNGQVVSCIMTSNAPCASQSTATSNSITMTVNNSITPSVSITLTNGNNPTCSGQSLTFTATPTNGGATPSYKWKINGNDAGTNSPTFTTGALTNGSNITCVMTSNASCANPSSASSNAITMTVNSSVTPSVTITASPNGPVCAGQSITFTASPVNGGNSPTYQWKVNGNNVATGPTYTTTTLTNGQIVSCVMTSNAACANPTTGTSNAMTMTINPVVVPTITISQTSCTGTTVNFSSAVINEGSTPSYSWTITGGGTSSDIHASTLVVTNATNNTQVQCLLISNASCANPTQATSNILSINCVATAIPNVNGVEEFSIMPNPNPGVFTVKMKLNTMKDVQFKITNLFGQEVYSSSVYHYSGAVTKQITVPGLLNGLYQLETIIGKEHIVNKIVILR